MAKLLVEWSITSLRKCSTSFTKRTAQIRMLRRLSISDSQLWPPIESTNVIWLDSTSRRHDIVIGGAASTTDFPAAHRRKLDAHVMDPNPLCELAIRTWRAKIIHTCVWKSIHPLDGHVSITNVTACFTNQTELRPLFRLDPKLIAKILPTIVWQSAG